MEGIGSTAAGCPPPSPDIILSGSLFWMCRPHPHLCLFTNTRAYILAWIHIWGRICLLFFFFLSLGHLVGYSTFQIHPFSCRFYDSFFFRVLLHRWPDIRCTQHTPHFSSTVNLPDPFTRKQEGTRCPTNGVCPARASTWKLDYWPLTLSSVSGYKVTQAQVKGIVCELA